MRKACDFTRVKPSCLRYAVAENVLRSGARAILAVSIAGLSAGSAAALEWDTDLTTPGAQGGTGDWNGGNFWWDATNVRNVAWVSGYPVVFGGTQGVVDATGMQTPSLLFNSRYVLHGTGISGQAGGLTVGSGDFDVSHDGPGTEISIPLYGGVGGNTVALTKKGRGTLVLSNENFYIGATSIAEGTLALSGGKAIPDFTSVSVDSGGTLALLSNEQIGRLWGSGVVDLAASTKLIIYRPHDNFSLTGSTFNGAIVGAGNLTFRGDSATGRNEGTYRLAGTESTFTGAVEISGTNLSAKTLSNVGVPSSLGAGSEIVFSNGGTLRVDNDPNGTSTNRAISVQDWGGRIASSMTLEGVISGSGTLIFQRDLNAGGLVVQLRNPASTFTGGLSVTGETLIINSVADTGMPSSLGLSGYIGINNARLVFDGVGSHSTNRPFFGNGTIEVVGGASLALAGYTEGTINKRGDGTLILSGASRTNGVVVKEGTLALDRNKDIEDSTRIAVEPGSTLRLLSSGTVRDISGSGNLELVSGNLTVNRELGKGGLFSGTISGSGGLIFKGGGSPSTPFAIPGTSSSFSGGVEILGGPVSINYLGMTGGPGPLGSGGTISLGPDGTLFMLASPTDRAFHLNGGGIMSYGGDLALRGVVSGPGRLVVREGMTFALEGTSNTFAGGVLVQFGTIKIASVADIGVPSSIGTQGAVTVFDGTISFVGQGAHRTDRPFILNGNNPTPIDVVPGGVFGLSSVTGTVGFVKQGGGTLSMEGISSDFDGPVTVAEGILQTPGLADRGLPSALGKGSTITLGGELSGTRGQLNIASSVASGTNRLIRLVGGGGQINLPNGTLALNGGILGSAPLAVVGTSAENSKLIIKSTHSGELSLEHATVRLTDGGAASVRMGNGSHLVAEGKTRIAALVEGGGAVAPRVTILNELKIDGANSGQYGGVIAGPGDFVKAGDATLTLTGDSTFAGSTSITKGTLVVTSVRNAGVPGPIGAGSEIRLAGASASELPTLRLVASTALSSNRVLALTDFGGAIDLPDPATTLTWLGQVNGDASSRLVKMGAGALRLSGANGFSGALDVQGGRLQVIGGNALPNDGNVAVATGATLEVLIGSNETIGALEGAGKLILASRLTTGGNNRSSIFSGVISGAGSNLLVKRGSGTFTLENSQSTFSGGVVIADGAVSVPAVANSGSNSPLGSTGSITLGDEDHIGRLTVTHAGLAFTNRPFSITSGGGAIDVRNKEAELVLSGQMDGPGSLLKLGEGRLRLTNEKSFSGAVVVGDGTFVLEGSFSGPVTILDPGTFETSGANPGTIGAFNLSGGTLRLGGVGAAGSLNTGSVSLDGGVFALDLLTAGGGHDHLSITGSAHISGRVVLTINLAFDPEDFVDSYRLVVNDGSDVTTFLDEDSRFIYQGVVLDEGQHFLVTDGEISQYFEVRYGLTEVDNDIRLVAAPEPGSALLLLGGILLVGGRRITRIHLREV